MTMAHFVLVLNLNSWTEFFEYNKLINLNTDLFCLGIILTDLLLHSLT